MQKRLTARIQKLVKKFDNNTKEFSATLAIDPDDTELVEKKGVLYAVFDISSKVSIDPLLVTKIVQDVLHDAYYSSESVSPIQSLEKAIVQVKDRIVDLPDTSEATDFNILAAALWGNVLYMVQFGKGGSFLVRENSIKFVNSATEGNFSEASGVVRDQDVVILGTQEFIDNYAPKDLVSGAISFTVNDLRDRACALIIKFESLVEFTEEEHIDFGDGKKHVENIPKPVSSISSKLPKISIKSVGKPNLKNIKINTIVLISVAVLLSISVFLSLKNKNKEISLEEKSSTPMSIEESTEENKENTAEIDSEKYKVNKVNAEVFYDLKIIDENVQPTSIAVLDNSIYVADSISGKLYVSSINTPKFEALEESFPDIRSLEYFGGDLAFNDNNGYKVYDGESIVDSYSESFGATASYLSFIYSVKDKDILKFTKSDDSLSVETWATSEKLTDIRSLAVDGSIYILQADGSLLKFYSGQDENFKINGLDKGLSDPMNIVKDVDLENIYIADKGNNRIVVINEGGDLQGQYVSAEGSWTDIRGAYVSRDEKTLYILNGTKVYNFDLN